MAEGLDSIRPIIAQYIEALRKNRITVSEVYLFGSYARQYANPDSDIDLAIVSNSFSGNRFLDRRKIVPLRRNIDNRIEPIPFTPDDFTPSDPLAVEILAHGIEIL